MSSNKTWWAMLLSASALAGCATPTETRTATAAFPFDQFKTPVTLQSHQLLLTPNAEGPSAAQRSALYEMINRWRASPGGLVVVETPNGAGLQASQAAAKIDQFMEEYGVAKPNVESRRYEADPTAAIRVTFPIYVVDIPTCGQHWADLARPNNTVSPNFGCATNANIAAMVSNPADMLTPRAGTPVDATRRQVVLEKYRQGEKTSSDVDGQARGVISKAIN